MNSSGYRTGRNLCLKMLNESKLFLNLGFYTRLWNGRSRGSSGSIVSDYGLDDRSSIPDRDWAFFF
jgi:hypothetical protein